MPDCLAPLAETLAPPAAENPDFQDVTSEAARPAAPAPGNPWNIAEEVARVAAFKPALDAAWAAFNVLDAQWVKSPKGHRSEDERSAYEAANDAAHQVQDQYDTLCRRILQVPVATVGGAMEKQRSFYRAYDAQSAELGLVGKVGLPAEEELAARDALWRDLAFIESLTQATAASALAFDQAMQAYQVADREWKRTGSAIWNGRPDRLDDGEWARLNLLNDEAKARLAAAREIVMAMPAAGPRACADKVAIYYDDYESQDGETLWLNASDIAALDPNDPEQRMQRDLARIYQDLERLAPERTPLSQADAELVRLSADYQEVEDRRDALIKELRAIHERMEPARDERRAALPDDLSEDALLDLYQTIEDEFGATPLYAQLKPLDLRISEITDRMEQLRATSLAGLRVKVQRAVDWRDADCDTREIDDLLTDLAGIVGLKLPPAFGFDAGYWISSYQRMGGDAYCTADGGLYCAHPATRTAEVAALEAELSDPAKLAAVKRSARDQDQPPPKWVQETRAEQIAQRRAEAM